MANGPKDYRDPKVTAGGPRRGGSMNWLILAAGIVLLLLILGWLLGWFGTDTIGVVPVDPSTSSVVPTEPGTTADPAVGPVVTDPALPPTVPAPAN